jgi:type IV secretion system protein VirB10
LDRLDKLNRGGRPKRRGGNFGVGALAIALALGGAGVAYFPAAGLQVGDGTLQTSDVEPFQERVNDALIAVEEALDVPAPGKPENFATEHDNIKRMMNTFQNSGSLAPYRWSP